MPPLHNAAFTGRGYFMYFCEITLTFVVHRPKEEHISCPAVSAGVNACHFYTYTVFSELSGLTWMCAVIHFHCGTHLCEETPGISPDQL